MVGFNPGCPRMGPRGAAAALLPSLDPALLAVLAMLGGWRWYWGLVTMVTDQGGEK